MSRMLPRAAVTGAPATAAVACASPIMAGLDPAISRGRVPAGMAGTVAGHDVWATPSLVQAARGPVTSRGTPT